MKRLFFKLLGLSIALLLLINPAAANAANGAGVVASAVIVPERIVRVGFLSTALVKDVSVQKGEIVTAGQTLAVLDTPELAYAITAADAAYRSAQAYAELQRYRTVKTKDFRGRTLILYMPREVILRADSLADAAHASLEVAVTNLALSTLLAPFDATVIVVNTLPGELAQPSRPIVTLATLDKLQIETTDLSERDITKVKVGQAASVFIEALDAEFPAKVIAIAPRADNRGGDVVFKVTLAFDKFPDGLLWGMTAEVTIAVE